VKYPAVAMNAGAAFGSDMLVLLGFVPSLNGGTLVGVCGSTETDS
jgi:hypothetical protein